jgi:hypothetical protein
LEPFARWKLNFTSSAVKRIAVVELEALAQLELVDALVVADRPGLGQAGAHQVAGHGLHEGVVDGVKDPERRELARHLARIEPDGGQRHVERPAHLAFGLRLGRCGVRQSAREPDAQQHDAQGESASSSIHAVIAMRAGPPPNARKMLWLTAV